MERQRELGLEESLMILPIFLASVSALCKTFMASAHCLWPPSPGATVPALRESKVMETKGKFSFTHISLCFIPKHRIPFTSADPEASSDVLGAAQAGFSLYKLLAPSEVLCTTLVNCLCSLERNCLGPCVLCCLGVQLFHIVLSQRVAPYLHM